MANPNPKRENLKPWKKGESGNPAGKEAGTPNRVTIYRKWVDLKATIETDDGQKIEGTVEDEVVLSTIREAKKGNVLAAKEILDSLYGKVSDKVQHSSDPDNPVTFKIDGRFKDSTGDDS